MFLLSGCCVVAVLLVFTFIQVLCNALYKIYNVIVPLLCWINDSSRVVPLIVLALGRKSWLDSIRVWFLPW